MACTFGRCLWRRKHVHYYLSNTCMLSIKKQALALASSTEVKETIALCVALCTSVCPSQVRPCAHAHAQAHAYTHAHAHAHAHTLTRTHYIMSHSSVCMYSRVVFRPCIFLLLPLLFRFLRKCEWIKIAPILGHTSRSLINNIISMIPLVAWPDGINPRLFLLLRSK